MSKKFALVLVPFLLLSCGQYEDPYTEQPAAEQNGQQAQLVPNEQPEQVAAAVPVQPETPTSVPFTVTPVTRPTPPQDASIPPVADSSNTNDTTDNTTGSTEPTDEPIVIAQHEYPRNYIRGGPPYIQATETKIESKGITTEEKLTLDIPKPPSEFNTCNNGAMLQINGKLPMVDASFKLGEWWLVASRVGFYRMTPEKPVYFYWATFVADDEIGIVPANFSTDKISLKDPEDVKIDLNYATLPYMWIDQMIVQPVYPNYPQECNKS